MPGTDTTTPYFMFEWHKRIQNYPPHSGITRYRNSTVTTHCYGRNKNSILLSEFYTLRIKMSSSHHQTKYYSKL